MSSSERHRASTQPDTMHSLSAASPCTSNAATLRQPRGAQRPCLAQARPGCGVQSSDEIDASRRGALLGLAASLASATLLGGAAPQVRLGKPLRTGHTFWSFEPVGSRAAVQRRLPALPRLWLRLDPTCRRPKACRASACTLQMPRKRLPSARVSSRQNPRTTSLQW